MIDPAKKAWLADFYKRHGEYVSVGGWDYFADGAACEHSYDPNLVCGAATEPDRDPYERAHAVLNYHRMKWQQAANKYETTRHELELRINAALLWRPGYPPPNPPTDEEVAAILTPLRDADRRAQAEVVAAEQAVEATKPAYLKDDYGRRDQASKAMERLLSIKV